MEDDDDYDSAPMPPTSFKTKLKHFLFCCFHRRHYRHQRRRVLDSPRPPPPLHKATFISTPTPDEKPTVVWKESNEMREKCMTVVNCMASGSVNGKHRRYASTEFRYDPLSYSLNFEDGFDDDDEAPLRNFSSRLPPTPPVNAVAVREIPAFS